MHLNPEALHRIISVSVGTSEVLVYETQAISTMAFERLEPMVFCDAEIAELYRPQIESETYPKFVSADYSKSLYEANCRTGLADIVSDLTPNLYLKFIKFDGTGIVFDDKYSGKSFGKHNYVYKLLEVPKTALWRLLFSKSGFSVKRTLKPRGARIGLGIDLQSAQVQTILNLPNSSQKTSQLWDATVGLCMAGMREDAGFTDEKSFVFNPILEPSALNTTVSATLASAQVAQIHIPLELPALPVKGITTAVQEQLVSALVQELQSSQVYALQTSQAANFSDYAKAYLSQYNWDEQARDITLVATRQIRMLDFKCVPIPPLEAGKDYAIPSNSLDMGLNCYGDFPAISWKDNLTDESKAFTLCRFRPPIDYALPWTYSDIGMGSDFEGIAELTGYSDGVPNYEIKNAGEWKKPFSKDTRMQSESTVAGSRYIISGGQRYLMDGTWDVFNNGIQVTIESKVCEFGRVGSFQGGASGGFGGSLNKTPPINFSPEECVESSPTLIAITGYYPYLDGPTLKRKSISFSLNRTGAYGAYSYQYTPEPSWDQEDYDAAESVKAWADDKFLQASSYVEIGEYKWQDHEEHLLFSTPLYGLSDVLEEFSVIITLNPPPES